MVNSGNKILNSTRIHISIVRRCQYGLMGFDRFRYLKWWPNGKGSHSLKKLFNFPMIKCLWYQFLFACLFCADNEKIWNEQIGFLVIWFWANLNWNHLWLWIRAMKDPGSPFLRHHWFHKLEKLNIHLRNYIILSERYLQRRSFDLFQHFPKLKRWYLPNLLLERIPLT